jgi:hypothetical protein
MVAMVGVAATFPERPGSLLAATVFVGYRVTKLHCLLSISCELILAVKCNFVTGC